MHIEVKLSKRRLAASAFLATLLPSRVRASRAESPYPNRPITLIVGYPPGGGADTLARLLAEHLTGELGHKVFVQNRPGAAGNIAAEAVVRTKPDGYTLYISTRSNTIHKSMYGHFDFDVARDLSPIGLIAKVPNVILTRASARITTVADLLAVAKTRPGELTYASTGIGSDTHLLGELFQQQTKTELLHLPYRGGAAAMIDVISGRVDLLIFSLPGALPYIKEGSVRAIALMSRHRVSVIGDIPTMAESGINDLNLETWFGLMAPAGTHPDVIQRLNGALNTVLMKPALQDRLSSQGFVQA